MEAFFFSQESGSQLEDIHSSDSLGYVAFRLPSGFAGEVGDGVRWYIRKLRSAHAATAFVLRLHVPPCLSLFDSCRPLYT